MPYERISFKDEKRLEPNDFIDAEAYAILPPVHGHGYNAVEELYGNTLSIFVSIRDDNKLAGLNQDYRQFGVIADPKNAETKQIITTDEAIVTFKLRMASVVDLEVDAIVYIDDIKHRIVSINENDIVVQQLCSNYHVINNYSSFSILNKITNISKYYEIKEVLERATADKYSGNLLFSSNNTPFILTSGRTFGIRSYIRF